MNVVRRKIFGAVIVILASATLSWIAFVSGIYVDILSDSILSNEELYGQEGAMIVRPSRYLFFIAIAVFVAGSLWGRKRIESVVAEEGSPSTLTEPAYRFSGTAVIIGIVFAAIAAISVFFDSFFTTGDVQTPADVRLWNTYLPIVLYTAVVVTALLVAFVFRKHRVVSKQNPTTDSLSASSPLQEADGEKIEVQRSVGLGFTLPIVAVALGLIVGLIVYDVTQNPIQVWIWVLIHALVAAGIIAGSWFARRAILALRDDNLTVGGAVIGSKILNFVLSVIFAVVVAAMSLGYGASAMEQLRISPSLSLSVYDLEPKEPTTSGDEFAIESTRVMIDGFDLKRQSDVTLTLEPGGLQLTTGKTDQEGYFWKETEFPTNVDAGEYTLEVSAFSADDAELNRSVPVIVSENDTVTLPEGDASYTEEYWQPRLMTISFDWIVSDLLPAFILLLLSASSIAITLRIRNPEKA